jgi:SAM-dependent methyltransferase
MMDSSAWDERYAASDLVWSATPNVWVEQIALGLEPGRAIDLAAGEGRNALWLAERGWTVTAVDFSALAIERARQLAEQRLGEGASRFTGIVSDLLLLRPDSGAFDLVLLVYLHIAAAERWLVLRTASECVAPGGLLVVVGHHSDNPEHGVGGPPDSRILYTQDDLVADLEGSGLVVERAERALRSVDTPEGQRTAIDAVLVARRPAAD